MAQLQSSAGSPEKQTRSKSSKTKQTGKVPSDIKIAQAATMKPIMSIAKDLGIDEKYIELYGNHKAKISLDLLNDLKDRPKGKYIDVTAITPTPLGEGK
ncbi:MAG: formate--tetrahydrofolate ligase, partial [Planctomycetes bacterium]|nr:formate--tetrahydrofolate ligase [Planctomycetota bacterium]